LKGQKGTGEETREKRRLEGDLEKELGEKEIELQLKKIKKKKTTGVDGMAGSMVL